MKNTDLLKNHFLNLHEMLVSEGEQKWASDINQFIDLINAVEKGELDFEEAKNMMQKKYKSMHYPHGGFGEVNFWRDDFNQRKSLNEKFIQSADFIWRDLKCGNKIK